MVYMAAQDIVIIGICMDNTCLVSQQSGLASTCKLGAAESLLFAHYIYATMMTTGHGDTIFHTTRQCKS